MHTPTLTLLSLVAALAQTPGLPPQGFRTLALGPALDAARAEKRCVLVDFRTRDAEPDRALETSTWQAPAVLAFIDERVVAIHLEFAAEPALAAKYSVTSTPTTLFLDADGDELERLSGVFDPDALLREGRFASRNAAALAPARKALRANPLDPAAHFALAEVYAAGMRPERAVPEWLWAWDQGASDASFALVRRSLVPMRVAASAPRVEGAKRQLVQRRDVLVAKLAPRVEGDDHLAIALDVAALNTGLGATEHALALWRKLRDDEQAPRAVVEALFTDAVVELLFRQKLFEELLAGRGDVLAWMDRLLVDFARAERAARAERNAIPADQLPPVQASLDPIEVRRNMNLVVAARYLEALCATGKPDDARSLIAMTMVHDTRGQAYASFFSAAMRGGDKTLAREVADAGLAALKDPAERARLERAIAREAGAGK